MIYVLGCHHDIQSSDDVPFLQGSPAVRKQRDHFGSCPKSVIEDKRCYINELQGYAAPTICL
jgi:hypothetical protein